MISKFVDHSPTDSVGSNTLDFGQVFIPPAQLLRLEVEGQGVRRLQPGADEDLPGGAVHVGLLDFRILAAPVRPVEDASGRIDDNGAGVVDLVVEEGFPVTAVQLGHLDAVEVGVGPVEVSRQPVDGHAFAGTHIPDDDFFVSAIKVDTSYCFGTDVSVVDSTVATIIVQGNGHLVFDIRDSLAIHPRINVRHFHNALSTDVHQITLVRRNW